MNTKKLYQPQNNITAACLPNWLIQIPLSDLSFGAKITYARLCKWAGKDGKAFRSAPQLSKEIGACTRQVERYIQELKQTELIGTFHPQAGGINHFEFYDHHLMHRSINAELLYNSTPPDMPKNPPTDMSVPPDRYVGTPPTDMSVIKDKKELINTTTTRAQILDINRDSEPVVVSSPSLTSTPNPKDPVNRYGETITTKLLVAYRSTPIRKGNIICEQDFLSAAYFSIDTRDKMTTTEQQRVNGICGLVGRSEFDEPSEWSLNLKKQRDRESGLANASLQEIQSAKKAILDPEIKGRDDAIAKLQSMGLDFKDATTPKLAYPKPTLIASPPKKPFKFVSFPEQDDIMFQPDMELIEKKEIEPENIKDAWEARL